MFDRFFPVAGAGLWDWGASWSGVSVAPWRIPLRTPLRLTTVKSRRELKGRRSAFRVRRGGLLRSKIKQGWATRSVATERCLPKPIVRRCFQIC